MGAGGSTGISIQTTSSGKFRAQVRVAGKRSQTRSFATKDEALMAAVKLRVELGADVPDGLVSPTVLDLLMLHLNHHDYAPTTRQDLQRIASKLPGEVRRTRLSDITPLTLTRIYQQLAKAGWTTSRVHKLHTFLSSAYGTGILYGWAASNPCRDAKKPKATPARTGDNVDEAVIRTVMELAAEVNEDLPTFIRLAANTGARRGELVALRWEDVDSATTSIWIGRSLAEAYGEVHLRDTKTGAKGHRRVSLGPDMMQELEGLRREGPWIFSHDRGTTPWRPTYVTRAWTRLAKGTGVRLHDLRHFMVTRWLSDGVPVHEVAARAGHTNPAVTQRIYAHAIPARDAENAARLSI